jgi:hypothetical protein
MEKLMPNIIIDEAAIAETNKALAAESIPVVLGLDVLQSLIRSIATLNEGGKLSQEQQAMFVVACNAEQIARHPPAWQWSERSSLTSLLVRLLEQAPKEECEIIWSDVEDIITGNA